METKVRANTDYSKSAKDLSAPAPTKEAYSIWWVAKNVLERAELEIEAKIPSELITARDEARKAVDEAYNVLKDTVTNCGGFQNFTTGSYALQQRKVSRTYQVEPIEMHFPKFAPAIIVKAVDVKKVEGLIKGGLITEERLKEVGAYTETETYAYVIK